MRSSTATAEPLMTPTFAWEQLPLAEFMPKNWQKPLTLKAKYLAVQLSQLVQSNQFRRVGIIAPQSNGDSSSVHALLLHGFEQLTDQKVISIDLNTGEPELSSLLGKSDGTSPPSLIFEEIYRIAPGVALVPSQTLSSSPPRQAGSADLAQNIDRLDADLQPDLMLFDLPDMQNHPDVLAMTPVLDAVLICVTSDITTRRDLLACKKRLEGVLPVIGTVLTGSRGLR